MKTPSTIYKDSCSSWRLCLFLLFQVLCIYIRVQAMACYVNRIFKKGFFWPKTYFPYAIFCLKHFFWWKFCIESGLAILHFFFCFETPQIAFDSMKVCMGKLGYNIYHWICEMLISNVTMIPLQQQLVCL